MCVDVTIRWYSTFVILEMVQRYRKVFDAIRDEDIQYVPHFDEEEGRSGKLKDKAYENVPVFVDLLKISVMSCTPFLVLFI